jgi:nicotinamide riboside transporter PnuC
MFKVIATMCGITGSILVALNTGLQSYGFGFFLVCSAKYAYDNIKKRDMPAAYLWTFYAMMDIYGAYRYFA